MNHTDQCGEGVYYQTISEPKSRKCGGNAKGDTLKARKEMIFEKLFKRQSNHIY